MPVDDVRRAAVGLATQLLERIRSGSLVELEVREGDLRVKVSRERVPAASAPAPDGAALAPPVREPAAPARPAGKTINAPLTGIFHRSPSPQAPPFVQAGNVVAVGDVIGLIEAMKLFNEVRSTAAGRVRRVAAENGELVRAHQPLVELE